MFFAKKSPFWGVLLKKTKIIFTTLVSRLEEGHKIKNPPYNKL